MEQVRRVLGVSERRACKIFNQARSTQRYRGPTNVGELRLRKRIVKLASEYGRYGYRRITALLKQEGFRVNHKRVERIWRLEGLKVPQKQPKRGRLWLNDGSCVRRRAEYPNHLWSYDFAFERTHNGKRMRLLAIVDEYTRECLAIKASRRLTSTDVIQTLADLFIERQPPAYLRSDNGPEFTANAVREWLENLRVQTLFIEPGCPWENGYVESFIGKLRDELLNREIFYTLTEARVLLERWRKHYNTRRPHSSLSYRPPAPEAVEPKTVLTKSMAGLT